LAIADKNITSLVS